MTTIESIDRWVAAAEAAGIGVRYEYFGGTGGGLCEIRGRRWLFIDLALSAAEQLERLETELADLADSAARSQAA